MGINDTLFLIPARGGSKGLPRKNILPLNNKALICYTIEAARGVTNDINICVSTDDYEIASVVEQFGLKINFIRPSHLATDMANSRDVILHALDYYQSVYDRTFHRVCLLQPTSPFRNSIHIKEALDLWSDNLDMVVSVKQSKGNPYFNLFEENEEGTLKIIKEGTYTRRQDAPKIWELNGAIYLISTSAIQNNCISNFRKVYKYEMDQYSSIDIDDEYDYKIASMFSTFDLHKTIVK